jgi:hypothetical protein
MEEAQMSLVKMEGIPFSPLSRPAVEAVAVLGMGAISPVIQTVTHPVVVAVARTQAGAVEALRAPMETAVADALGLPVAVVAEPVVPAATPAEALEAEAALEAVRVQLLPVQRIHSPTAAL